MDTTTTPASIPDRVSGLEGMLCIRFSSGYILFTYCFHSGEDDEATASS